MRYASIIEFKSKKYLNIRKFYSTKEGKHAPSRKGISLSIDQFKELVKVIPHLESEIA